MPSPMISALGGFSQVGMVVRSADEAMRSMTEKLGIGPFFVLREITLENFWYGGAPSRSPVLTIGLAQAGPVQIEIIEQHDDAPSIYADFLASGREGCQHFGLWFSEREAWTRTYDQFVASGARLMQQGGSIEKRRFAFFETDLPGQPMIELSESLLPETRPFTDAVAQASIGWSGADPIRTIAAS